MSVLSNLAPLSTLETSSGSSKYTPNTKPVNDRGYAELRALRAEVDNLRARIRALEG